MSEQDDRGHDEEDWDWDWRHGFLWLPLHRARPQHGGGTWMVPDGLISVGIKIFRKI